MPGRKVSRGKRVSLHASYIRLSGFVGYSCGTSDAAHVDQEFRKRSLLTFCANDVALRSAVCYTLFLSAPKRGIVSPGQRGFLIVRWPAARSLSSLAAERSTPCPP